MEELVIDRLLVGAKRKIGGIGVNLWVKRFSDTLRLHLLALTMV